MTKIFEEVFITKDTIKQTAIAFLQENTDPIDAYLKGKELEEISKEIMAHSKEDAIEVLKSLDDKKAKAYGCWVATKAVAPAYDFSDNPEWVELNFKIKQLEADRKKIETLMIEASRYGELKDTEGRKITPAKISREASVTLQVTIPKE
jgi:hypothetical protein